MPRMETIYYCNHCGRSYFSEEKAIECETQHLFPVSVDKPEYDENDSKKRYPLSVLVHLKDENGKMVSTRYYRK